MLAVLLFVELVCLLIVAVGALGIISPDRLLDLVRRVQTPAGIGFVAILRIALGVALYLVAPASRAPAFIAGLGLVVILIGLITPFVGLERYRRVLDTWARMGSVALRIWAASALAFGFFLAYLVWH